MSVFSTLGFRNQLILVGISTLLLMIFALTTKVAVENQPLPGSKLLKNGNLIGGDFIAFYIGGRLFNQHPEELYNLEFQRDYRSKFLGSESSGLNGELPFVYPPLVAYLCSFVAELPFSLAFEIWSWTGLIGALLSLAILASQLSLLNTRTTPFLLIGALGFFPLYANTFMGGQLSWIGIILFCSVSSCLIQGKNFLAGLTTALAYYKPPLFIVLALCLWIRQGKNYFWGAAIGSLVLTALTLILVGFDGFQNYLSTVSNYTYGQKLFDEVSLPPAAGMGIYAALTTALPSGAVKSISMLLIVGLLAVFAYRMRSKHLSNLELALYLSSSVALSLQCIKYDLALLLPPFLLAFASKRELSPKLASVLSLIVLAFYFEFSMRNILILEQRYNASSFLFIPLLITLLVATMNRAKSYDGNS